MDELVKRLVGWQPAWDDRPLPEVSTERMEAAMASLSAIERVIIEQRFGLTGHMPGTLTAIGKSLHRSPERIRFIESRALRKLRYRLKDVLTVGPLENETEKRRQWLDEEATDNGSTVLDDC